MHMKNQSVSKAFAFKFIERIAVKGIGFAISIVLARLLAPEIFGLLAIIEVFINLAQTFVHGGMGTALVQNPATREDDYSTVFFLSFGVAIIATIILFFSAPLIGQFYENDMIVWPLRVLSFSLLFGALNSVQMAKFQREMRFREMMICNLVATTISGTLGVVAAFLNLGLWALVIHSIAGAVLTSVCLFISDRWHPKLVFSLARAKEFWSFGWKMLASALLCSLYSDVRALIIGKKYTTTDLAYYNRGNQFPNIISNTLDVSIQSVMLPVMSKAQNSQETMNAYLFRSLSLSAFIVTPAMLGLSAISRTFFPLLLTEKWNNSIPLLTVFCLAYLLTPIQTTNLSLVMAKGRSDLYMKMEVIRRVVMMAILLPSIFCFDSVMIIAVGFLLSSIVDSCIIVAGAKRLTGIGLFKQLSKLWKILLSGAIMALVVYFMNGLLIHPIIRLALQIVAGAAIYIGVGLLLKAEPFLNVIHLLQKRLGQKGEETQ